MSIHLNREIPKLKKNILALGAAVEELLRDAVVSVTLRDVDLARRIIAEDPGIDEREVDIEEECLKILALYQPVANDLRFIVAVLKINNDLERIGDLAVDIAERAVFLAHRAPIDAPYDFQGMADKVQSMVKRSLDALVSADTLLAQRVCEDDDEVDDLNREMYDLVQAGILEHPEHIDAYIHLLGISRHLERIADHATNIAEDVIYMVLGEIVRHRLDAPPPTDPAPR